MDYVASRNLWDKYLALKAALASLQVAWTPDGATNIADLLNLADQVTAIRKAALLYRQYVFGNGSGGWPN